MGREEVEHEGSTYWTIPGYSFGITATAIIPRFRPPSRYKARNLDHFRLISNAEGFVEAEKKGIKTHHRIGEKSTARIKMLFTPSGWRVSEPFFSDSALAATHAGSARKAAKEALAASWLA